MMVVLEDAFPVLVEVCIHAGTLRVQRVHFATEFIQVAKESNQVRMSHAMDAP